MSSTNKTERTATEFSFGIVPLRRKLRDAPLSLDNLEILLIEQKVGHRGDKHGRQWCFPKGHRDHRKEPPLDCAKRELEEETNLRVAALIFDVKDEAGRGHYASEYFNPVRRCWKRCEYWAAEVDEGEVRVQEAEVADAAWLDIDSAIDRLTHREDRDVLERVKADLASCTSP